MLFAHDYAMTLKRCISTSMDSMCVWAPILKVGELSYWIQCQHSSESGWRRLNTSFLWYNIADWKILVELFSFNYGVGRDQVFSLQTIFIPIFRYLFVCSCTAFYCEGITHLSRLLATNLTNRCFSYRADGFRIAVLSNFWVYYCFSFTIFTRIFIRRPYSHYS